MTKAEALAFTGLAPKLFAELERAGSISGRRYGRNGATVYLTSALRETVVSLFGTGSSIDDEFEGLL